MRREATLEFREWLKDEMAKRRWSESELGRQSGLASSIINRWVRGEWGPNANSALKIANAFGVDPEFVLELAGHRPRKRGGVSTELRQLFSSMEYVDWSKPSRMATVQGIVRAYMEEDNQEIANRDGNNARQLSRR